ncbi:MAG: hypothetical protein ACRCWR_00245, partial [Saezia sp.]
LTSVTDNTGRKVTYHWTGDLLTGVTDVEGNLWGYAYDGKGNLTQRIEPDGTKMTLTVNGESAQRKGTHLNSQKNPVYIYPERASSSFVGVSSSGSSSARQRGRLLSLKRADEEAQAPTPPRVGTITATNGATTLFNINYNRAAKQFTATQTDELGKTTTEVYDSGGRLLSRSINGDMVFTLQYTGKHYIQSTDERGLSSSITYNEAGKPIRITHPNGSVETYTYDNTFNQPLTYTNQLGIETQWTYDNKGNALTRIDAVGKEEQRFNSWTYDTVGQAVTYSISTQANASEADKITTRYAYDANGNINSVTDPLGNTTQLTHNNQGQVTSVTNALGHTWTYEYTGNGHLKRVINPLGNNISFQTDAQGRIAQVTDAEGRSSTVTYSYQNKGLVMTKTDALGNATVYEFNPLNQLTRIALPSGNTVEQNYDAQGRLKQKIDFSGNISRAEYGALGTMQSSMPEKRFYPTYQESSQYNALGLPTEVKQQIGDGEELTRRMSYNALGMLLSVTQPNGATTQLQYDAFGNQTKHIDALGSTTQQTYDAQGNVTSVVDAK